MRPDKHKLAKEWIYGEATPMEEAKATWESMDAEFNANRKIQLAEKDNFNTPDLEQSPDSFLRPGETLEDFDVTFRRPNAQGGRMKFYKGMSVNKAPNKLKIETPATLTGKAGDRKLTKKQIDALDPDYLGKINIEDAKNVKVYKSGSTKYGSVLDDAIEIRNIIVKNKGNIFNLEELGEKAGIYTNEKGNRPDLRRVKAALEIAKDNFSEIANFKMVPQRYKGIDGKERNQLNMVVDSIKNYQNSKGADKLAHFLPENMGMNYKKIIEKGSKNLPGNPDKGIYFKLYNFSPEKIRYITDRITDETGQVFTPQDYKNLMKEVKDFRGGIGYDAAQLKRATEMNADIKKLYDDKVIQKLIKGDLDNNSKKKILERAVNIIDDDVAVASRRLFMMAQSIAGTRPIEGIEVDENLGKKIIDTQRIIGKSGNNYAFSGLVYDHYGRVIDNALDSPKGKSFIGYYQQRIKNALDGGLVPDEIFSVTASGRRNMSPYAIFTQALDADVNSSIKGANLDSLLSKTHRDLQNIFKGKKYNQLNTAEKKAVQELVGTFESAKKNVLKDLKPNVRNTIQLAEFDLKNPPSKSIANYDSYDKNLQKAFDKTYQDVGYSMKVPQDMKTQKQLLTEIESYGTGKSDKNLKKVLKDFEAHGCGKAAGGRILFSNGGEAITTCAKKGVTKFINDLKNGNYSKATMSLLRGGGNLVKNILDPRELLRLRNYFGPTALGFLGLYEAGVITDDVVRQGTPLNESLANNWLTKSFVPYTKDYAQAVNLMETGTVPSNMQKYVTDVQQLNKALKEIQGIDNRISSRLVDQGGYGMMDGTSMYTKEQQNKEEKAATDRLKSITDYNFMSGSAKDLEYKKLIDEMEATRMAKPKEFMGIQYSDGFNPIFGFGNLKDRNQKTDFDSYISAVDTQKDLRPVTYMDAEYTDVKTLPASVRKRYEDYFSSEEGGNLLKPRQSLSDLKYGDSTYYDELLKDYNKFQRQKEASQYAGYYGTQEPDRFMEGGIASLNVNKK